jgi:hypothetical protein
MDGPILKKLRVTTRKRERNGANYSGSTIVKSPQNHLIVSFVGFLLYI